MINKFNPNACLSSQLDPLVLCHAIHGIGRRWKNSEVGANRSLTLFDVNRQNRGADLCWKHKNDFFFVDFNTKIKHVAEHSDSSSQKHLFKNKMQVTGNSENSNIIKHWQASCTGSLVKMCCCRCGSFSWCFIVFFFFPSASVSISVIMEHIWKM